MHFDYILRDGVSSHLWLFFQDWLHCNDSRRERRGGRGRTRLLNKTIWSGGILPEDNAWILQRYKGKSHHIISKHLWQLEMWERAQQQGVLWWRQFYLQIDFDPLVSEVWIVIIQPIWLFSFTWNGNCHDDHIQKERLSAKVSECRQSSMSLSINISTHGTLSHCLWLLSLAHIVFQDSPFLLQLVHLRWPRTKGGSCPPPS